MSKVVILMFLIVFVACQDDVFDDMERVNVTVFENDIVNNQETTDLSELLLNKFKLEEAQTRVGITFTVYETKKNSHKYGFTIRYDSYVQESVLAEMELLNYLQQKMVSYRMENIEIESDIANNHIAMYFPAELYTMQDASVEFHQFEMDLEFHPFSYAHNVDVWLVESFKWTEDLVTGGNGNVNVIFKPEDGLDAFNIINDHGKTTLTKEQENKLIQAFERLTTDYPLMLDLIYFLAECGVEIEFFVIGTPGVADAGYWLSHKLAFVTEGNITSDVLMEELLHAVQHACYGDFLMNDAHRNVEFEVKMLQDAMFFEKNGSFGALRGAFNLDDYVNDPSYIYDYQSFVLCMAQKGGVFDMSEYQWLYSRWQGYLSDESLSTFEPGLLNVIVKYLFE